MLGIMLAIAGVSLLVKASSGPMVTNFDELAGPATGGEKLSGGGVAKPGELIKPAGYNVDGLMNGLIGLALIVGGIYRVYSAAAPLFPAQRPAEAITSAALEPPAVPSTPVVYSVVLLERGTHRTDTIKALSEAATLSIMEAAKLVDQAPSTVRSTRVRGVADALCRRMTSKGLNAVVKAESVID